MSIEVQSGDLIPLSLVTHDRVPGKYVRVKVYDVDRNLVGTRDLVDNGDGTYDDESIPMTKVYYLALYDIYDDSGYSVLSPEYNTARDEFTISLEQTILNKISQSISGDPFVGVLEASSGVGALEATLNNGQLSSGQVTGNLLENVLTGILLGDDLESGMQGETLEGELICG